MTSSMPTRVGRVAAEPLAFELRLLIDVAGLSGASSLAGGCSMSPCTPTVLQCTTRRAPAAWRGFDDASPTAGGVDGAIRPRRAGRPRGRARRCCRRRRRPRRARARLARVVQIARRRRSTPVARERSAARVGIAHERADVVALRARASRQMTAGEPGRAGDEHAHRSATIVTGEPNSRSSRRRRARARRRSCSAERPDRLVQRDRQHELAMRRSTTRKPCARERASRRRARRARDTASVLRAERAGDATAAALERRDARRAPESRRRRASATRGRARRRSAASRACASARAGRRRRRRCDRRTAARARRRRRTSTSTRRGRARASRDRRASRADASTPITDRAGLAPGRSPRGPCRCRRRASAGPCHRRERVEQRRSLRLEQIRADRPPKRSCVEALGDAAVRVERVAVVVSVDRSARSGAASRDASCDLPSRVAPTSSVARGARLRDERLVAVLRLRQRRARARRSSAARAGSAQRAEDRRAERLGRRLGEERGLVESTCVCVSRRVATIGAARSAGIDRS